MLLEIKSKLFLLQVVNNGPFQEGVVGIFNYLVVIVVQPPSSFVGGGFDKKVESDNELLNFLGDEVEAALACNGIAGAPLIIRITTRLCIGSDSLPESISKLIEANNSSIVKESLNHGNTLSIGLHLPQGMLQIM